MKKHFEIYQKECEKWIDKLGLTDWEASFNQGKRRDCAAWLSFDCLNRCATFHFSDEQTFADLNPQQIKANARHEVLELLLGRLRDLAGQRYGLMQEDIDEECHVIIERLQKVIIKKPL